MTKPEPIENRIYIAQHPANSVYYIGSSMVFRTVFAMVADDAKDTAGLPHGERTNEGFRITIEALKTANLHMHVLLYGFMRHVLEAVLAKSMDELDQTRINVLDAPDPDKVGLPAFIDIGKPDSRKEANLP